MLANGSAWSSLVRTISQSWGPMRGGWMFMLSTSILAVANGHRPAGCFHCFFRELRVDDLIDGRLLLRLDVADRDAIVDRPLRTLWIHTSIHRPDAVLGLHVD